MHTMPRPAPLFDRVLATAVFEIPSAYFRAHPKGRLARRFAGPNPARWYAVRTHADEVLEWAHFEKDDDAGQARGTFTKGTLIAAPNGAISNAVSSLERDYGGTAVAAVAFRVGKALVAAEIPPYTGNQLTPPEDVAGHRAAILGIGNGALWATVGALHLEANEFMGADMLTATEAQPLQNLAVLYSNTPRL
jgi:hypothetical protein